ncbi:MAG: PAS domain S-box protein [Candidatus Lokiarchaeota archaeon]|nr:PAS domain S-box protein [Candidatus Lokiarchaeota archaeon]
MSHKTKAELEEQIKLLKERLASKALQSDDASEAESELNSPDVFEVGEADLQRIVSRAQYMLYRMALPSGEYEFVSAASSRLYGYTPEEFLHSPMLIRETIHPDWRDYFADQWNKLLADEMPPFYEYQIIHKSGEVKWLHQQNVMVRDEQGRPAAVEGVVSDVTRLKETEAALKERIKELNCLHELAHIVESAGMDTNALLSRAAELLPRAWQFSKTTAARITFRNEDFVAGEFEESPWELSAPMVISGREVGRVVVIYKDNHLDSDEGPFLKEERALIDTFAERLGHVIERIESNESLVKAEARYHSLYENAPDMYASVDAETGLVKQCNKTLLTKTGFAREEIIGKPIFDRYAPDSLDGAQAAFHEFVETGEVKNAELKLRRKDGGTLDVFLNVASIRDGTGCVVESISSWRDITDLKQIAAARQASEERFQRLVTLAPIPLCYVNTAGQIEYRNRRFLETFGYTEEDVPDLDTWWSTAYPDETYRQWVLDTWNGLVERATTDNSDIEPVEYRITCKNGQVRTVLVGGVILVDGFLATFIDITDRNQAEAELLRERDFSNLLLNAMPGVFYVLDIEGRFHRWNENFIKVSGYSDEEFAGMSALELFDGSDRNLVTERIGHVFKEGTATVEANITTKDGRKIPYYFTGLRIKIDNEPRLIGMGIDITEQKRANEELATIFKMSTDMICVADINKGTFVKVSPSFSKTLGYSEEEIAGTEFLSFNHPDDVEPTNHVVEDQLKQGKNVLNFENRYRCKDGTYKWLEWVSAPDAERGLTFAIVRDVTQRKCDETVMRELNESLARSNKELEQFAYVASHDLQEPLRMVASYTQLLAERYEGQIDEKADKYIRYAMEGSSRMQRLINDLLAFSRVGTRAEPLKLTDCNQIVCEALQGLEKSITETDAEVVVGDLPQVMADRTQLGQVFQNLIGNAIKFRSKTEPRVEITSRRNEDMWEFIVADNGIGIDPRFFDRIFIIFQRLHGHGEYHGSGIGLSIVKKVIERHSGRIRIESEPGKGARFIFTLPVTGNKGGSNHG